MSRSVSGGESLVGILNQPANVNPEKETHADGCTTGFPVTRMPFHAYPEATSVSAPNVTADSVASGTRSLVSGEITGVVTSGGSLPRSAFAPVGPAQARKAARMAARDTWKRTARRAHARPAPSSQW